MDAHHDRLAAAIEQLQSAVGPLIIRLSHSQERYRAALHSAWNNAGEVLAEHHKLISKGVKDEPK